MRQRPQNFRINRNAKLAKGLVFAGLGGGASTLASLDSSGYGNNGTLTNMDPPTDWLFDTTLNRWVLDFDGSNDSVTVTSTPSIDITGQSVTVAAWFIMRSSVALRYNPIVCKNTVYSAGYGIHLYSGFGLEMWVRDAGGFDYTRFTEVDAAFPLLTSWHHLCGVFSGTSAGGDLSLYCDGVLRASKAGSDDAPGNNAGLLYLGDGANALDANLDGKVSDACVWDRVLSQSEISALADPANVSLSGLIVDPRRRLIPVAAGNRIRRVLCGA